MTRRRLAALLAAAFLAAPLSGAAETLPGIPGHVLLARAGAKALVVWDATPEIAAIVAEKKPQSAGNLRLERKALRILAQMASKFERDAVDATVRVTYEESGDVSPVYGTMIFAGIERYATLSMPLRDIRSDRDRWKELGPGAAPPKWIDFKIVGRLPPG